MNKSYHWKDASRAAHKEYIRWGFYGRKPPSFVRWWLSKQTKIFLHWFMNTFTHRIARCADLNALAASAQTTALERRVLLLEEKIFPREPQPEIVYAKGPGICKPKGPEVREPIDPTQTAQS